MTGTLYVLRYRCLEACAQTLSAWLLMNGSSQLALFPILVNCLVLRLSAVTLKTFDDSDTPITYLPSASAWKITATSTFFNGATVPQFSQATYFHAVQIPGASASLSFSGEAVALYGTVSPIHDNIHIVIDSHSLVLPAGSGAKYLLFVLR